MSSTGITTSISSGLRTPASTMVTGRGRRVAGRRAPRCRRGSGRSPRAGAAWPTGRCAAGLVHRGADPVVEALEREGQVAAPLGGGQRVDLVDDHGLDALQRLARRRGEHEVERLGRGDEDVGRVPHEAAALVGRGVAGAHADRRLRARSCRAARPRGGCPGAGCAGSSRRRRRAPAAARRRGGGCGAFARSGAGRVTSRSMPHRKADSVLPEPVGARIRVWSPPAMAGQPWAWGGVGSGNEVSNQARTAGENGASGSTSATPSRYRRPLTGAVRDGPTGWRRPPRFCPPWSAHG